MNGHEFDRGDAERLQIVDGKFARQTGVCAAQILREIWTLLGEAFDMDFVDYRAVERRARRTVSSPIERGINNYATRGVRGTVELAAFQVRIIPISQLITERLWPPHPVAIDGPGVRSEHQLREVKAMPFLRGIRSVRADAVRLAGLHARHEAMPDAIGVVVQRDASGFPAWIEGIIETDFDARRMLGKHGEICALRRQRGSQRMRRAGPTSL